MPIFKKNGAELGFEGKEVHTNPSLDKRLARNTARMRRVKNAMRKLEDKGDNESVRYEMLRREFTLRKLQADMSILQTGG